MKIAYGIFCTPMIVTVTQWATTPLEFVILLAAAIGAIGVLWTKGVKPIIAFCLSAVETMEHVRQIPAFQDEVLTRLQVIEGALYGTDQIDSLSIRRRDDG